MLKCKYYRTIYYFIFYYLIFFNIFLLQYLTLYDNYVNRTNLLYELIETNNVNLLQCRDLLMSIYLFLYLSVYWLFLYHCLFISAYAHLFMLFCIDVIFFSSGITFFGNEKVNLNTLKLMCLFVVFLFESPSLVKIDPTSAVATRARARTLQHSVREIYEFPLLSETQKLN